MWPPPPRPGSPCAEPRRRTPAHTIAVTLSASTGGANIGDLLDRAGATWGWFQGGFASPGYVSGRQDQANHQYDLKDFWAAAGHGNLPQVSYQKAPDYQDGHAGYSDPLDEQRFIVSTVSGLERLPAGQTPPW